MNVNGFDFDSMICMLSDQSRWQPLVSFLFATMVAVGEVGLYVVPTAAHQTRSQRVLVHQDPASRGEIQSEGRSVAQPRPGTVMGLAVKWRQLTVRALLLGKDALLRTVMGRLKSLELSAEVLAESGLLILLGAEQSWIRAGIGVERNIFLEKWKKVLSRAYSNDAEWMQKCKAPLSEGCHSMTSSKWSTRWSRG